MKYHWLPGTAYYLSKGELELYISVYSESLVGDEEGPAASIGHQGVANLAKKACQRLAKKGIVDPTPKQIKEEMSQV